MRALTLTQPFATLIAHGEKRIETRDWRSTHRGPLAIHAAKGFSREDAEYALQHPRIVEALGRHGYPNLGALPFGCVVAVAILAACEPTEVARRGRHVTAPERWFGDFSDNRWAWHMRDVLALPKPIPARGHLGLWEWHDPATERWLAGQGWPGTKGVEDGQAQEVEAAGGRAAGSAARGHGGPGLAPGQPPGVRGAAG